jgi:hypothetical protein
MTIALVFEKDGNFFAETWQKIAENCDHNIDPRNVEFLVIVPSDFSLA